MNNFDQIPFIQDARIRCAPVTQELLQTRVMLIARAFHNDRIAVRFEYEFHDSDGKWFRAHGNEVR